MALSRSFFIVNISILPINKVFVILTTVSDVSVPADVVVPLLVAAFCHFDANAVILS